MTKPIVLFSLLLAFGLANLGSGQAPSPPKIRVLLSEVQPGSLAVDRYCTLVFTDHHFHSEKASRHHGKDNSRKVYEGELLGAEWDSLVGILDSKEFRELNIPQGVPPLVMQDSHPYTISVERDGHYQNMEFLDGKSLKPYEPQIKPLLQWWKSLRGRRVAESNAPANESCSLDSTHGIVAQ